MAEANTHEQDFTIRNLLTRSATLYPARVQVMPDIDDITRYPGTNEITIYGLAPTADESSIKVGGKSSATITDRQIEHMPNRELFEDVCPLESDDEDIEQPDDEGTVSDAESELIRTLNKKSAQNEESLEIAREGKTSASSRLAILENSSRNLEKDRPVELEVCVLAYSKER
ncbi:hypothetical protein N7G274_006383 [Stereocaulon virgatum]|uniref:DUF4140 domain-containing protein n=1 Tax=Stereocaulon virgatum TaxID=373712 RepID=A0ABR4A525_9LECA